MKPGLDGGDNFAVIDVVVDLGMAAVAIALSGVLFLNSRRHVVVRGRTIRPFPSRTAPRSGPVPSRPGA